ncbi:MAG: hypothetical protein FJW39_04605 [Acidobacteria bacterium]|nr:hypothetical protein [Acidobacteriota bacterium]
MIAAVVAFAAVQAQDTESLKPETLNAFQQYVRGREARMERERIRGGKFLWLDESRERLEKARSGEVVVEAFSGKGAFEVKGGLVHDWTGAAFLPGTTLTQVVSKVQDYDRHKDVYQPEVIDSKLRSRQGNRFKVHLRLLKKKVITVVLNTEHDVEYFTLDAKRAHSRSYTTRVAEVEDAGTARERERPMSDSHGFLWRLNSYWRFEERDGGVYVECEAISLTRGVPFGLGVVVMPIIRDLPRESLVRTMEATRTGLK